MAKPKRNPLKRNGGAEVFAAYYRHYRTGQIVYPKTAKAFRFSVKK